MSERLPKPSPESLEGYQLGDTSLREWHTRLTTDAATGERNGYLATPGSRYGSTSDDCAYWALANGVACCHANGVEEDLPSSLQDSLDYLMGLAVNDHPYIAEIALEYWEFLPAGLREQLGTKREVKRILEGGDR